MTPTNISAIFESLQENYGIISPNLSIEKEDVLKDRTYDAMEPINSVFNKLERFSNLCKLITEALSDRRKIMHAYKIISNNNVFMDSLKIWNRKTLQDKTFVNMKIFFREKYIDLDEVGVSRTIST